MIFKSWQGDAWKQLLKRLEDQQSDSSYRYQLWLKLLYELRVTLVGGA